MQQTSHRGRIPDICIPIVNWLRSSFRRAAPWRLKRIPAPLLTLDSAPLLVESAAEFSCVAGNRGPGEGYKPLV